MRAMSTWLPLLCRLAITAITLHAVAAIDPLPDLPAKSLPLTWYTDFKPYVTYTQTPINPVDFFSVTMIALLSLTYDRDLSTGITPTPVYASVTNACIQIDGNDSTKVHTPGITSREVAIKLIYAGCVSIAAKDGLPEGFFELDYSTQQGSQAGQVTSYGRVMFWAVGGGGPGNQLKVPAIGTRWPLSGQFTPRFNDTFYNDPAGGTRMNFSLALATMITKTAIFTQVKAFDGALDYWDVYDQGHKFIVQNDNPPGLSNRLNWAGVLDMCNHAFELLIAPAQKDRTAWYLISTVEWVGADGKLFARWIMRHEGLVP